MNRVGSRRRASGGLVVAVALAMTMLSFGGWPSAAELPAGGQDGAWVSADEEPIVEPVVTFETERERYRIPYRTVVRKTDKLRKGHTKVDQRGRAGVRLKVFRLTLEDGLEVDRELVSNSVVRKPVNRIVLKGTRVEQPEANPGRRCDPNYSGCVPIASDVDCAGGSGNGPAYARGPVRVIGDDIYDLDADGDGWACD